MEATMTLVKKSLHRQIMEAAGELGKIFETAVSTDGRLMYKMEGVLYTPGEFKDLLGKVAA